MSFDLISDKYLSNSQTYPIVLFPQLMRDHFPQIVQIEEKVLIKNQPQELTFLPANLVCAIGTIFLLCTIAIATKILNLHHHNSIAIAAMTVGIINCGWGLWQLDKAETAHQRRIAARSTQKYRTITRTILTYPNWEQILAGLVRQPSGISTAKRGVAEDGFARYLNRYFPDLYQPSYSFDIPDSNLAYSADFCLQLPCGLSIDVEIDEPYVGNTKEPHHCSDGGKDDRRNQFFIDDNWLVVRFSEQQIVLQPQECCYLIARLIAELTGVKEYLDRLSSHQLPTPDRTWTISAAKQMAKSDYRQTYLGLNGKLLLKY